MPYNFLQVKVRMDVTETPAAEAMSVEPSTNEAMSVEPNAQGPSKQTILGALHDKYDAKDDEELQFVIFVPKSAPGKKGLCDL